MTCPICSGSGERDNEYGLLSCDAPNCTAATERAALEAANKAAEPMTFYDQRWFAYGLGKAVHQWQPIDTAPKDGTAILLYLGGLWARTEIAVWFEPWANWQQPGLEINPGEDDYYGTGSGVPTHWMPLPKAPE